MMGGLAVAISAVLPLIERRLHSTIGLNAETLGPGGVAAAIKVRMSERGVSDAQEYVRLLEQDAREFAWLVEELVVPETWFFRDIDTFRDLCARATSLLAADPSRTFRALSVPCATGEEPYTIAMALLDAGIAPGRFHIDAVDISRRSIALAQRAVYGTNSFRGKDIEFRDRFFTKSDAGFVLDASVRQSVAFHENNLVEPCFLAGQAQYHAIFCRNVLIYLHPVGRETALASLDRLLAPGGVLFAGHAEALETMTSRFKRAGSGSSFAYARDPAKEALRPAATVVAPRQPGPASRAQTRAAAPSSRGPTVRAKSTRPRKSPIAEDSARESIDRAAALADRGELSRAAAACEKEIALRPSAAAFSLLGVIRKGEGNVLGAEECFARALYLEPAHREALLHMALICEGRGDAAAASNYRRRAERAQRVGGAA